MRLIYFAIFLFCLLCEPSVANTLTNGLIAHLTFNGDFADSTGKGFDGSPHGGVFVADRTGRTNSAYRLNGSNEFITLNRQLPDSEEFTVSAWIRPQEDKRANIFYDAAIFTPGRDMELALLPTGHLVATFTKVYGAESLRASNTVPMNTWSHVAMSISMTNSRLFVNGQLVAQSTNGGGNIGFHSTPYVGAANHGVADEYFFSGDIDELKIYGRALPTLEVQQLFYADTYCPPQRASAEVQVVNGFIVGATISNPGCGYTNPPVVFIEGEGGSGATAVAIVENGRVTSIRIENAGCCYTNGARIIIASPPFLPSLTVEVSKVRVRLNVTLGRRYLVESSADLIEWTATGDSFFALNEDLSQEFDVQTTGRFFRVLEVP